MSAREPDPRAPRVRMLNVGWFTAAAGVWRRGESMDRRVRFPIFGHDHDAQAASAERLRALRDAGARVLPVTIPSC